MRPKIQEPTNTTTIPAAGGGGFQRWNSPIPYLFGGLAMVMGMIALALLILACSYKISWASESESSSSAKTEMRVRVLQPEMEPRVVVIMAGETNPTHLAKPVAAVRPLAEKV